MAGPWIKMSCDLDTNPHVLEIASLLNTTEIHVVGMLWKVWSWADAHSIDGNAIRVTSVTLDRFTGVTGFAEAMRQTGWLEGEDGCLSFPRFSEHNGETAKKRAETAKRVAKHRNASRVTDVTLLALPEENRGEENTGTGTGAEPEPTGVDTTTTKTKRINAVDGSNCQPQLKQALAELRIKPKKTSDGSLKGIPDEISPAAVAAWWRGHLARDPLTGDTALDLLHVLCSAAFVRKSGTKVANRAASLAKLIANGKWTTTTTDLEVCYHWIREHIGEWILKPKQESIA